MYHLWYNAVNLKYAYVPPVVFYDQFEVCEYTTGDTQYCERNHIYQPLRWGRIWH